jgi:hypothetical protein
MRAVVGVGAVPSRKVWVEVVGGSGGWKWWVEVVGGSGGWKWDQMTKDKHTLSMFKKQNGRRVQLAVGELSRK